MNIRETDTDLFGKIKSGDVASFEQLFKKFYPELCFYATRLVKNSDVAEEIVQDFFVKLWEKKHTLDINTSLKNYLYRSVKNLCLNFVEHNKVKNKFKKYTLSNSLHSEQTEFDFLEIDLYEKLEDAIYSLPEKRQKIFRLNREEGLKYREIAEKLNLSIKTVETQMGLAFKYLREKLKHYNFFLTLFIY
jgi:RNA polymerase sigma-70 factor (ECF subfamily)